MRTARTDTLLRALGAAALLVAVAAPPAAHGQGIRNTAHDLSRSSTISTGVKATTDNEICKFCHAPHRASSTQLLWNRRLPTQAANSYNWGTDDFGDLRRETVAGTELPGSGANARPIRTSSRLCLGCHDGTIALGEITSSGTPIAMANVAGRTSGGKLIGANVVGAGGSLSGSHPVSIPYAGQTYNGIVSAIPASKVNNQLGGYWQVKTSGCDNSTGICTQATGTSVVGARIQLFPNVPYGTTNAGIECTTCHEVHNKYALPLFMRLDATTSDALCRSCHNK